MSIQLFSRRVIAACSRLPIAGAILCAVLNIAGCPTTPVDDNGTVDNSTFDSAVVLQYTDGKAEQTASSLNGSTVDFYKLGTLSPGDRVVVDVRTTSGDLDPVAAIFDANQDVFAFNDDRNNDGNLNPLIDVVIRTAGDYFVGVTPFPAAGTSGGYRVSVTITGGGNAPTPSGQLVYFNWAGGKGIVVENVGTFDLDAFDAAQTGLTSDRTAALKARVEQLVAARYAGFNITFQSSDRDPIPGEPHTTVNYGGFSRSAFAISEQIDTLNSDHSDNTIVFTESFDGAFSRNPTAEQMAIALANTTAHELGHLLGLVHTKQCSDLMDTTCGNNSILVPQSFERAPLDSSVFPSGFQDSHELLGLALGLAGI